MVKTLLLCFIHGFQGDEETFFQFPEVCSNLSPTLPFTRWRKWTLLTENSQDLRNLVAEREPDLNIHIAVYPKYETRGDLAACVETFREWYNPIMILLQSIFIRLVTDFIRLQDRVTDLERSAATPLAIMNPSVGVILIAHSMG